jgi:hypothetical protein
VTNANGTAVGAVTATFVPGGGPTEEDLSVNISPPAGGGGGGFPTTTTSTTTTTTTTTPTTTTTTTTTPVVSTPIVTTPTNTGVNTNVFGGTTGLTLNSSGVVQSTVTFTSADGKESLTVPSGTTALDASGNPITNLTGNVDPNPPVAPEGQYDILALQFQPAGATFNPPLTLTFNYNTAQLAALGISVNSLVVGFYNDTVTPPTWQFITPAIDTTNDTVTVTISHFSAFALIGSLSPTTTNPNIPITTSTTASSTPAIQTTTTPSTNWGIIWGIIVIVIILAIIITVVMVTRKKKK